MDMEEYLSPDELATLNALQAKAKRIQRAKKADKKFFEKADERKDELLTRWGITIENTQPYWQSESSKNDNRF